MRSLHSQARETLELCMWLRDTYSPGLHHQITKSREVLPKVSAQKHFRMASESKLLAMAAYAHLLTLPMGKQEENYCAFCFNSLCLFVVSAAVPSWSYAFLRFSVCFFLEPVSKVFLCKSPSFRPSTSKAMMELVCAPSQDDNVARQQDVWLPFYCGWHVVLGTWPTPARSSQSPCLSFYSWVRQLHWSCLESYPDSPPGSLLKSSGQVWYPKSSVHAASCSASWCAHRMREWLSVVDITG